MEGDTYIYNYINIFYLCIHINIYINTSIPDFETMNTLIRLYIFIILENKYIMCFSPHTTVQVFFNLMWDPKEKHCNTSLTFI